MYIIKNSYLDQIKGIMTATLLVFVCSISRQTQGAGTNDIELSKGFKHGLTLAAYKPLEINGKATPGRTLDVKLQSDKITITMARVMVNRDGSWAVSLLEQAPGGPYQLKITDGDQSRIVHDVFIGRADQVGLNPEGELILSTRIYDNMVLQPGDAIDINGRGEPGRTVDIKLIKKQAIVTMARAQIGSDGQWQVRMSAQEAGGPFELKVSDSKHYKTVKGIIIGRADTKETPLVVSEKLAHNSNTPEPDEAVSKEKTEQKAVSEQESIANNIASEFLQVRFDDSSWSLVNLMSMPNLPENDRLIARKYLHLAVEPQEVKLSIGQENQIEQIIINGQILDAAQWQKNPLQIKVPSGVFRSGDNIICLVSAQQWDNTRFLGSAGRLTISIDQFNLDFSSNWRVFPTNTKAL